MTIGNTGKIFKTRSRFNTKKDALSNGVADNFNEEWEFKHTAHITATCTTQNTKNTQTFQPGPQP